MLCTCITRFVGSPGSQSHQNGAKASPVSCSTLTLESGPRKEPASYPEVSLPFRGCWLFYFWQSCGIGFLLSLSSGGRSNCRHWPLLLPGTAVGWEAPPGKKAPAMSFLAYYKESKIYQIENSYYYRDMLTKRNSIKLPQNTKHRAQRAAFIHLLRVYVGAEIYSVSHKRSVPLLLKGMSTGSCGQGRL